MSGMSSRDASGDQSAGSWSKMRGIPVASSLLAETKYTVPSWSPTPAEARSAIRTHAESKFKSWTLLNAIILRREATLRKRWMKKNQIKRREIPHVAWPNMERSHRPDFDAIFQKPKGSSNKKYACMWPYINLEDLLKPSSLPILLTLKVATVRRPS